MTYAKTEDLNATTRASIIQLCIAAHQEEDFKNLFTYVPSGGWHFLAYRDKELVSHALVRPRLDLDQGLTIECQPGRIW